MKIERTTEQYDINFIPEEQRDEIIKKGTAPSIGRNWDITKAMGIRTNPDSFYRVVGDRAGYDLVADLKKNGEIASQEEGNIMFNKGYAEQYLRGEKNGYIVETTTDAPVKPADNVKPSYYETKKLSISFIKKIWRIKNIENTDEKGKSFTNAFGQKSNHKLKKFTYELVYENKNNKRTENTQKIGPIISESHLSELLK